MKTFTFTDKELYLEPLSSILEPRYRFVGLDELEDLKGFSLDESHEWVGLLKGKDIVGFIEYHDDGDNEIFIDLLFVNKPYRNNGFASILLSELVKRHPSTMAFTGLSTFKAVSYWQSKGANFEPLTFAFYQSNNPELEEEVFPFALSVSTEYRPYWTN